MVHGFGEKAGAPLASHPGVNLICFTGEPATAATVIADVTEPMSVFQEEIFGPVLVATRFDGEEEAIPKLEMP
jgi:5-carboxymethyl-2-hydroxymuconic-semialdehyde dehydrogenase